MVSPQCSLFIAWIRTSVAIRRSYIYRVAWRNFLCPQQVGTWIPQNRGKVVLFYVVRRLTGMLLLQFICSLIFPLQFVAITVLIVHILQILILDILNQ